MNLWLELGIEGMAKFRKGQFCGNQKRKMLQEIKKNEDWEEIGNLIIISL